MFKVLAVDRVFAAARVCAHIDASEREENLGRGLGGAHTVRRSVSNSSKCVANA